jgi:hypothetical protein
MTSDNRPDEFADRLRQRLEASVDSVDELTAARLQAARKRAIATVAEPRRLPGWLPAGGFATAAVVVLTLVLWNGDVDQLPPGLTQADWELLAEADLPLIEELDFYDWLAEEDVAG